jgi:hypothetical protein
MDRHEQEEKRQDTLRKMQKYGLHASEVDILEEAGEL